MKRMLLRAGRFLKRYRAPLCAGILVSALGLTAYRAHIALAGGTFVRTHFVQPIVTQMPEPTREPALLSFPATGELLLNKSASVEAFTPFTWIEFSAWVQLSIR